MKKKFDEIIESQKDFEANTYPLIFSVQILLQFTASLYSELKAYYFLNGPFPTSFSFIFALSKHFSTSDISVVFSKTTSPAQKLVFQIFSSDHSEQAKVRLPT